MPITADKIIVALTANLANLKAGLTKGAALIGGFATSAATKLGLVGASFSQMALAAGAITAVIGIPLKKSADAAIEFEQKMANVVTVTDAVGEEFDALRDKALEMGRTTSFTAREVADSMFFLGSAGFNAQQVSDALEGTLKLAEATMSDLAQTTEIVVASINQYNFEAKDATRVSNVFAATIKRSQATMSKLGTAMSKVGPVASAVGRSIEETSAALGTLFSGGLDASTAGTSLRRILINLIKPTDAAQRIFEKYGLTLRDISPEANSFADIVDTINEKQLTTAELSEVFGARAISAIKILTTAGGEKLRDFTKNITGTNDAFTSAATQLDTTQGAIKLFKSAVEGAAISLGDNLSPGIRSVIEGLTGLVTNFNNLSKPTKAAITAVLGITVALTGLVAIVGILKLALPLLAGGFTLLTGPFGIILGVLGALGAAFVFLKARMEDTSSISESLAKTTINLINLTEEYREVVKKLADENNDLSNSEKAVLEIRKATLKLDITKKISEINNAYAATKEESQKLETQIDALNKKLEAQGETYLKTGEAFRETTRKYTAGGVIIENTSLRGEKAAARFREEEEKLALLEKRRTSNLSGLEGAIDSVAAAVLDEIINERQLIPLNDELEQQIRDRISELQKLREIQAKQPPPPDVTPGFKSEELKASIADFYEFANLQAALSREREVERELQAVEGLRQELGLKKEALNAFLQETDEQKAIALANELGKNRIQTENLLLLRSNLLQRFSEVEKAAVEERILLNKNANDLVGKDFTELTDQEIQQVQKFTEIGKQNMEDLKNTANNAFNSVFSNWADGVSNMIVEGEKLSTNLGDFFKNIAKAIAKAIIKLVIMQTATIALNALTGGISGLLGFKDGGLVGAFANGGIIRGKGTGRSDSNLAKVSNGEFVVNQKGTKENLGLLSLINNTGKSFGELMGFNRGGLVGMQNGGMVKTSVNKEGQNAGMNLSLSIGNIALPNVTNSEQFIDNIKKIAVNAVQEHSIQTNSSFNRR